ncbi:MAG: hypothetical protein ACQESP_09060 [Candidatus Muiribacteriota bacterium]
MLQQLINKITGIFYLKKKINLLDNIKIGFSAGRAFNKVVSISGYPELTRMLQNGEPVAQSLNKTGHLSAEEFEIIKFYEKMGKLQQGFESIIEINETKLDYFITLAKSMAYPVFLGFAFIMIFSIQNLIINGLTFGLIFRFIFFAVIYVIVIGAIVSMLNMFFGHFTKLVDNLSLLKCCASTGINFDTVKNFFKNPKASNYKEIAQGFRGIRQDLLQMIQVGEMSGELESTIDKALKRVKKELDTKLKGAVIVVSISFYLGIVLLIVIKIFSTMTSVWGQF